MKNIIQAKIFLFFPCIISIILWSGCANKGEVEDVLFSKSRAFAQIEPRASTKSDVQALLGEPSYVAFTEASSELWTYYYIESESLDKAFRERKTLHSPRPTFIWDLTDEKVGDKFTYTKYLILTIAFNKNGVVSGLLETIRSNK